MTLTRRTRKKNYASSAVGAMSTGPNNASMNVDDEEEKVNKHDGIPLESYKEIANKTSD